MPSTSRRERPIPKSEKIPGRLGFHRLAVCPVLQCAIGIMPPVSDAEVLPMHVLFLRR